MSSEKLYLPCVCGSFVINLFPPLPEDESVYNSVKLGSIFIASHILLSLLLFFLKKGGIVLSYAIDG